MAASPQFVGTARNATATLVNASGTTAQTLLTMGAAGGLIESLFLSSNDTISRNLTILLGDGSVDVLIDTVTIPAATAARPVVQVSLMDPYRWAWLDPNNVKWALAASRVVKIRMEAAVSASAQTSVIANYGEF